VRIGRAGVAAWFSPDPRLAANRAAEYDAAVQHPQVQDVPSKPPPGGRLRRPLAFSSLPLAVVTAVGLATAAAVGASVAATMRPSFYRDRLAAPLTVAAEQAARRLVTKLAALQAALDREGSWEAALAEDECNGWLAVDMPRNHAALLPAGWSDPRLALEPGRVRMAARRAVGPLDAVVALAVDVRLRQRNVVECTVTDARLGAIPLPRAAWLHWLAARLGPCGLPTEIRRRDGGSVLAVTLPAAGRHRVTLDALAVGMEEILFAGTTTRTAAERSPEAP
jgi:hypothetical protein